MLLHYLRFHLARYTEQGTKILSKYDQYLSNLYLKKSLVEERYLAAKSAMAPGVQLIKLILDRLDLEYLKSKPDDESRYYNYWNTVGKSISTSLYTTHANKPVTKYFVNKGLYTTDEYIIPTTRSYLTDLPFDKPYEEWKNVKPLQLLYHNGIDYSINITNERIKFYDINPTVMLLGLDVISLGMKYYSYISQTEVVDTYQFIHDEILIHIIEDLIDIWLAQQLGNIIDGTFESDVKNSIYSSKSQILKPSIIEVKQLIDQISNGKDPSTLINSFNLISESLLDRCLRVPQDYQLDISQRNYWIFYLRDSIWLDLLVQIHKLNPTCSQSKTFFNILTYRIKRFSSSKFWNEAKDVYLKAFVKRHFDDLCDTLDI